MARAWQARAQVCDQWQGHIPNPVQRKVSRGEGRKRPTVRFRGIGTGISEANKMMIMLFTVLFRNKEFLFFPLLHREASKRVPIFDRGTGSKPERLRSGFLQADLSLIV
jgi:hypothetical protein